LILFQPHARLMSVVQAMSRMGSSMSRICWLSLPTGASLVMGLRVQWVIADPCLMVIAP
jgi:hypothetical protein